MVWPWLLGLIGWGTGVVSSQETDREGELSLLLVGNDLSEGVSRHLAGFFAADGTGQADVRFIDTGEGSLSEAWAADDFLASALLQGGWDVVLLQESEGLSAAAALADHPEIYGEGGPPEEVLQAREAFWGGAPPIGETLLAATSSRLGLFPAWPLEVMGQDLETWFPEGARSREALRQWTEAAEQALREAWEVDEARLLPPSHASSVWPEIEAMLGADLFQGEERETAAYLTAAVLYREIARRPVVEAVYDGPLAAEEAAAIRERVDRVLQGLDPLPLPDPAPVIPEPFDLLFVGGAYMQLLEPYLIRLFEGDPRAELRTLRVIAGDGEADWFALTRESELLANALAERDWDKVIMEEAKLQAGLAGVYTNRREAFGVGTPAAYSVGSYRFLHGAEEALNRVLGQTAAPLIWVSPWPMRQGEAGLSLFPREATPLAMRDYLIGGHQLVLEEALAEGSERFFLADLGGVWMAAETRFPEIDWYGEDGVWGAEMGHVAMASALYEWITGFHVTGSATLADWPVAPGEEFQRWIGEVTGIVEREPVPEVMPEPEGEDEMDGDGDPNGEGGPNDGEDGDEAPQARPIDLLLSGGRHVAALESHLLALFEADPRVRLRTLRRIAESGEDFFALTQESDALAGALADEAWDAVVLEAPGWQAGLAGVFANRRSAFGVGTPAEYSVASYRFTRGGQQVIDTILAAPGPELVWVSPWAVKPGEAELALFPRGETPEAMQAYHVTGFGLLLDKLTEAAMERVRLADLAAAWFAGEAALPELDFYGADGVLGGLPGHYVSACVLYEMITGVDVEGLSYDAGLGADAAAQLQALAGEVSGVTGEPEEPGEGEGETPEDPGEDGGEGEPEDPPGEDPAVTLRVLLLGAAGLERAAPDLLAFLQEDPAVVPELTIIVAEDWRALEEDPAVGQALAQGDWDVVVMQEAPRWPGLAEIYRSHRRTLFEVGIPAPYTLANYHFFTAGARLLTRVLQDTTAQVVLSTPWPYEEAFEGLLDYLPGQSAAEMQRYTNEAYAALAAGVPEEERSRLSLAALGDAWLQVEGLAPGLDLYAGFPVEGGQRGHYLSGAFLYEVLTGTPPTARRYRGEGMRPFEAEFLRLVASGAESSQLNYQGARTLQAPSLGTLNPDQPWVDFFNAELEAWVPAAPGGGERALFETYSSTGTSEWADHWAATLDFSGVAWDHPSAGTLIADQFMVSARHFSRGPGAEVRFTDRNGAIVSRVIEAQEFLWFDEVEVRTDIMVSRLDAPVPDSVAIYRVVPGDLEPDALLGAKVLSTYSDRTVALSEASRFQLFGHDSEVVTTRRNADVIDPAWDREVVPGDSGHPSFLVLDGELLLFSAHTFRGYGSKGPYYGGLGNHAKILRAMERLTPSSD